MTQFYSVYCRCCSYGLKKYVTSWNHSAKSIFNVSLCVANMQHVNSFAARHSFCIPLNPFKKRALSLPAPGRERLACWPLKHRPANEKVQGCAALLKAPSCICESSALCRTTPTLRSCTLVQLLPEHMVLKFWGLQTVTFTNGQNN